MNKNEPIFKLVFGEAWDKLPPVFQKRYMNRPYSNDVTTVEGEMEINYSKTMSCLMPFFRLLHVLVPYKGKNIPVKVDFRSHMDSDAVCLYRKFYFPGKQPYEFNSCMYAIQENTVVERMNLGMGWKTHYFYDGKKVVMQHKGYVWRVFGLNIRIPLEIFVGIGHAEEEVIDDNSYKVTMSMTHPWFGLMYSYSGNFTFKRLAT